MAAYIENEHTFFSTSVQEYIISPMPIEEGEGRIYIDPDNPQKDGQIGYGILPIFSDDPSRLTNVKFYPFEVLLTDSSSAEYESESISPSDLNDVLPAEITPGSTQSFVSPLFHVTSTSGEKPTDGWYLPFISSSWFTNEPYTMDSSNSGKVKYDPAVSKLGFAGYSMTKLIMKEPSEKPVKKEFIYKDAWQKNILGTILYFKNVSLDGGDCVIPYYDKDFTSPVKEEDMFNVFAGPVWITGEIPDIGKVFSRVTFGSIVSGTMFETEEDLIALVDVLANGPNDPILSAPFAVSEDAYKIIKEDDK